MASRAAWLTALATVFATTAAGIFYAFGLFAVDLRSLLKLSDLQLDTTFAVAYAGSTILIIPVALYARQFGIVRTCVISCAVALTAWLALVLEVAYPPASSSLAFIITMFAFLGTGWVGDVMYTASLLVFTAPPGHAHHPDVSERWVSVFAGCLSIGFGLGGTVFTLIYMFGGYSAATLVPFFTLCAVLFCLGMLLGTAAIARYLAMQEQGSSDDAGDASVLPGPTTLLLPGNTDKAVVPGAVTDWRQLLRATPGLGSVSSCFVLLSVAGSIAAALMYLLGGAAATIIIAPCIILAAGLISLGLVVGTAQLAIHLARQAPGSHVDDAAVAVPSVGANADWMQFLRATPGLWSVGSCFMLLTAGGSVVAANVRVMAESIGLDQRQQLGYVIVYSVAQTIGRVGFTVAVTRGNSAGGRLDAQHSLLIVAQGMLMLLASLLALLLPTPATLGVCVAAVALAYGGSWSVMPGAALLVDSAPFERVWALSLLLAGLGPLIAGPIVGAMYDTMADADGLCRGTRCFKPCFALLAAMGAAVCAIALAWRRGLLRRRPIAQERN